MCLVTCGVEVSGCDTCPQNVPDSHPDTAHHTDGQPAVI